MGLLDVIDSFNFDAVGIASYDVLSQERDYLDRWLADGCHGNRAYMERHRREDPRIVLPDCQTLIIILFAPQVWEYHAPIRARLKELLSALQTVDPTIEGRGVVDTAPVMERAWARRAGLGWIGRNSLLINEKLGSNFNIGILLINKSIEHLPTTIAADRCQQCDAPCVAACPVDAIRSDRTIDCRICLSAISQDTNASVKGCRVCQNACPFNNG